MPEHMMIGQTVHYNRRKYRNVLVRHIEQDTENRGIDTQYGTHLTYGQVTLPVDQMEFVVIQRNGYWLVVDTI